MYKYIILTDILSTLCGGITMYKTENIKENGQNQDQSLFEDLECRYGFAMAQDIIDQLKKAENLNKKVSGPINYMAAKALSEAAEIYRLETKTALSRYKNWQNAKGAAMKDVIDMEGAFLKKELQRSFQFYRRFHKAFFVTYRQAIETYKTGTYAPKQDEIRVQEAWDKTTLDMAA